MSNREASSVEDTSARSAMKLALEALEDLGMKHFESTGEVLHKEVFDVLKEALSKQEQPYAHEAAMYSNDRMTVDPQTGNVSIGTIKQEQRSDSEQLGEPVARLKLMMEESAFEGRLELSDALLNIDEFYTAPQPKQEQGEPVAEKVYDPEDDTTYIQYFMPHDLIPTGTKLYTTPQQRKPLTEEQLIDLWPTIIMHQHTYAFARAIEAAHGITASEAEDSVRSKT